MGAGGKIGCEHAARIFNYLSSFSSLSRSSSNRLLLRPWANPLHPEPENTLLRTDEYPNDYRNRLPLTSSHQSLHCPGIASFHPASLGDYVMIGFYAFLHVMSGLMSETGSGFGRALGADEVGDGLGSS